MAVIRRPPVRRGFVSPWTGRPPLPSGQHPWPNPRASPPGKFGVLARQSLAICAERTEGRAHGAQRKRSPRSRRCIAVTSNGVSARAGVKRCGRARTGVGGGVEWEAGEGSVHPHHTHGRDSTENVALPFRRIRTLDYRWSMGVFNRWCLSRISRTRVADIHPVCSGLSRAPSSPSTSRPSTFAAYLTGRQ